MQILDIDPNDFLAKENVYDCGLMVTESGLSRNFYFDIYCFSLESKFDQDPLVPVVLAIGKFETEMNLIGVI